MMAVLSIVFSVLVIASLCVLVVGLIYGAFVSREDPRFEGDKIIYRS